MSGYGLFLFNRVWYYPDRAVLNLTRHAPNWTRSIRAKGGFFSGDFTITNATMTTEHMIDLYQSSIGRQVREYTTGIATWEGEVVEMTLTVAGVQHTMSLDIEKWHNKVKVKYAFSETAWSETTDSSDIYGESCYIDYVGGTYDDTTAQARRDRRLEDNAFPRSRSSGGLATGGQMQGGQDSLHVMCAGYVLAMNRRFQTADIAATNLSDQISTLVGNSEFVTAGMITENTLSVPVNAAGIEPRLWDMILELIDMGDANGARYAGGVYEGRLFNYVAAPLVVTHRWHNGRLTTMNGNPILPTLVRPNIIVQISSGPFVGYGYTGNVWDEPQNTYIEEVEFIAPDSYRLIPAGGF